MRKKRTSYAPNADRISELEGMLASADSSPLRPSTRKRHRVEDDNPENSGDGAESPSRSNSPTDENRSNQHAMALTSSAGPSDTNLVAFAKHYSTSKRLRPEDVMEMEAFAADPIGVRQVKMMVDMRKVLRVTEEKQSSKPPYQVSKPLNTNILRLSKKVLGSTRLSAYKGETPINHVVKIVRAKRFDLPPGIEKIPSDWELVLKCIGDHLTQVRGKMKSEIEASIEPADNARQHTTLFDLAEAVSSRCDATVTIEFCARVAIFRKIMLENNTSTYWDSVDNYLADTRKMSEENDDPAAAINRIFKKLIKVDRQTHGNSEELPESVLEASVSEAQNDVDDVITT